MFEHEVIPWWVQKNCEASNWVVFFLCFYCLGVLKPDMTDGWCKYVKCNFTAFFKEEKSQYNLKKDERVLYIDQ